MLRWCLILLISLTVFTYANDEKKDEKVELKLDKDHSENSTLAKPKAEGTAEAIPLNETLSEVDKAAITYYDKLEELLPNKTKEELEQIAKDDNITPEKKYVKFHDVFNKLPDNIKEQIPLPPIYQSLPDKIRSKIKAVFRENTTFEKKQEELEHIYQTLTDEEKKMAPEWAEMRENVAKDSKKKSSSG